MGIGVVTIFQGGVSTKDMPEQPSLVTFTRLSA